MATRTAQLCTAFVAAVCLALAPACSPMPAAKKTAEERPTDTEPNPIVQDVERLADSKAAFLSYRRSLTDIRFLPYTAPWDEASSGEPVIVPVSDALRRIVAAGADAVPTLLENLSNDSVLAVQVQSHVFRQPVYVGHVRLQQTFVDLDRRQQIARADEVQAAARAGLANELNLSVAELSYFALGQIVNRPYYPIQSVSKYGVAVTSPLVFPDLADELRREWSGLTRESHATMLVEELGADGPVTRRGNAYARLAYYYPDRLSGAVIAALDSFKDFESLEAVYLVSSLVHDSDTAITDHLASMLRELQDREITSRAHLLAMKCVDRLLRTNSHLEDARAYLLLAQEVYPESRDIQSRLSAVRPAAD